MENKSHLSLSQIGLYNPQRASDEVMLKLFIVRKSFFEFIMDKIKKESENSIPQHYLIIAQRGMGKSTLLKRIEVELRINLEYSHFIPLLFPEEQYNLKDLAEFWLNCLDAVADTLQTEKQKDWVNKIDHKVKELDAIRNKEELAKSAHTFFMEICKEIKRRPVLLVDNLNLIFDRLNKSDQHTLRALLMQNNAPIILGASVVSIEDIYNYGAPFYDAFQILYLSKLTYEELIEMLKELAVLTNAAEILPAIHEHIARLKTIYQLTGGNTRTAVMLFKLIVKGFSNEVNDDLEALLDEITPLYKARFEELPDQMQRILDVVALNWDPIPLEGIRKETRLENNQLSPQLKRLVETGWIEKLDAYKIKGSAYQISERFFNIWYLMRRSSRRQKRELLCLSKFLESYYGADLNQIAWDRLSVPASHIDHVAYTMALAEASNDPHLKNLLQKKGQSDLIELAKDNPAILTRFEISDEPGLVQEQETEKSPIERENEYLKALKLNDKSILNWLNIAQLYHVDLKKYEDAEKAYLNIIKLNPYIHSTWMNLGNLYHYHLQKYEESEEAYLKVTKLEEKPVNAWNELGILYQNHLQRYKDSEEAYLKAIKMDENNPLAWNNLGNLYQEYLQRYEESENAYLKAIELDEKYAYPWNGLGNLYQHYLKKYKDSEKAYMKSIDLDKKNAYPWYNLGNLYQDRFNKYEESEKAYMKSIDLDGKFAHPWYGLGNLYQNHLLRYIESEKAYLKAIELNERFSHAWTGLGNLYQSHLKRYEDSEKAYLKAIELDNKIAFPWNSLGNLYQIHYQKYDKSEKAYLKAIEIDNKNAVSWSNLGELYQYYLQRYDESEKSYLKAIELNINFAHPWNGLGNLYQDYFQKFDASEKAYLKAIELDDQIIAKINLIFLYRDRMGKIEEAKKMFQTLPDKNEVQDSYWLNKTLFDLYERNLGKATGYLQNALDVINGKLPPNTQGDWWRFGAITYKLGYADWLLGLLEEGGNGLLLSPYFIALRAMKEPDSSAYLNSKAVEIREPARMIMEKMQRYL